MGGVRFSLAEFDDFRLASTVKIIPVKITVYDVEAFK